MAVEIPAEPFLRRWKRRAVTIPAYLGTWALVLALLPVVLPMAAVWDVARGVPWVGVRCALFFAFYLTCEVVGLAIALAFWLARPALTAERYEHLNFRLEGAWCATLFWGGARIFGWSVEITGEDAWRAGGPLYLFMRHASTADSVVAAGLGTHRYRIRLRHVLKAELLRVPCLDVVGNRIPNAFVRRGRGETERAVALVEGLARGLGPRDGVLLYPEGTRFTPEKQRAALEQIEKAGDAALLARARALRHVLPPKLAGPLALLEVNQGADVVFGAHTGFEGARTFEEFQRGGLVGSRVRITFWRVPLAEIPRDRAARIAWLYDQWERVEAWVTEHAA